MTFGGITWLKLSLVWKSLHRKESAKCIMRWYEWLHCKRWSEVKGGLGYIVRLCPPNLSNCTGPPWAVQCGSPDHLHCHSSWDCQTKGWRQNQNPRLERWISSKEHSLLLKRTQVWSPEPMSEGLQLPVTPAPRAQMPFSGLHRQCTHMHIPTYGQIYICIIKN